MQFLCLISCLAQSVVCILMWLQSQINSPCILRGAQQSSASGTFLKDAAAHPVLRAKISSGCWLQLKLDGSTGLNGQRHPYKLHHTEFAANVWYSDFSTGKPYILCSFTNLLNWKILEKPSLLALPEHCKHWCYCSPPRGDFLLEFVQRKIKVSVCAERRVTVELKPPGAFCACYFLLCFLCVFTCTCTRV